MPIDTTSPASIRELPNLHLPMARCDRLSPELPASTTRLRLPGTRCRNWPAWRTGTTSICPRSHRDHQFYILMACPVAYWRRDGPFLGIAKSLPLEPKGISMTLLSISLRVIVLAGLVFSVTGCGEGKSTSEQTKGTEKTPQPPQDLKNPGASE